MKLRRCIHILAFPLAEIALFLLGTTLLDTSLALAAVSFFLSACALNYAIHISFHEWVHHGARSNVTLSNAITILSGLPLNGYRLHHANHHQYDNGPGDLSSTWNYSKTPPTPRGVLSYSLLWPLQMYRVRVVLRKLLAPGGQYAALQRPIQHEKLVLAGWYLLLIVLARSEVVLAYGGVTYLGWAFAAIHNYGQHIPQVDTCNATTSYISELYNRLFCNNGLHHEHHEKPGIPWYALDADPGARRVSLPHPLAPLVRQSREGESSGRGFCDN